MMDFASYFLSLFIESAPWLLLGFALAGLIKVFVPQTLLTQQLGGAGFGSIVKAALIGAPLPLCSCGVVPTALGLRRSGASKNTTVAFLVATPETGVDSVSVSYALLGPVMAVIRPITAISSAIVAGILVGRSEDETVSPSQPASSCCSQSHTSCESEAVDRNTSSIRLGLKERLREAMQFSFGKMLDDIVLWLLVGLLVAAAVLTWVPATVLAQWGSGPFAYIAMMLVGVPMYICATASTPIAAGLLAAGVSPGAVLVFMMAGPATNLGTLAIIRQELGRWPLTAYLLGVLVTSAAFGFALDTVTAAWGWDLRAEVLHQHDAPGLLGVLSSAVLAVLVIRSLGRELRSRFNTSTA